MLACQPSADRCRFCSGDGQTGKGCRRDSARPRLPGRLDRLGTRRRSAERPPLTAHPRRVSAKPVALGGLSRIGMWTTVDHGVAIGRAPALMTALVDDLRIHRCSNASLHVLPLRLAHPAQDAHQHLVRGIATIEPATELRNPDIEAVGLEAWCGERELVAEPAAGSSPTTTPVQPRASLRSWLSRADAASRRSHGTDRDCPARRPIAAGVVVISF